MSKIGVSQLYLEKVLTDTAGGYTTDTPYSAWATKLVSIEITPNSLEAVLDASDATQETDYAVPNWTVNMVLSDITPAELSMRLVS